MKDFYYNDDDCPEAEEGYEGIEYIQHNDPRLILNSSGGLVSCASNVLILLEQSYVARGFRRRFEEFVNAVNRHPQRAYSDGHLDDAHYEWLNSYEERRLRAEIWRKRSQECVDQRIKEVHLYMDTLLVALQREYHFALRKTHLLEAVNAFFSARGYLLKDDRKWD